jgi:hypothetical protein
VKLGQEFDTHRESEVMMFQDAKKNLSQVAPLYASAVIRVMQQEYPNHMQHIITGPDDQPTPRELHPAFYGCFDWHSSVEMHWVLVRLLRLVPDAFDSALALEVLDAHLTRPALQQEARYMSGRRSFERPYGWGWALTFIHELTVWEHERAATWLETCSPLADAITDLMLDWLPKATYPVRVGMHSNSAFGLARSLPWAHHLARQGDDQLLVAIQEKSIAWFGDDRDYPAHYEPSGSDFLSPALTELDLMSQVLDQPAFLEWLDRFLPGLPDRQPDAIFAPAYVSDESDGQLAHLHGLNLYRAFVWKHLAGILPAGDRRRKYLDTAASTHARASLGAVTGSHYMVEHWLACYAVLYLSGY